MATSGDQQRLFEPDLDDEHNIHINERCRLKTRDGLRIVFVSGLPLMPFPEGDRAGEAYTMVCLVDQGWAAQHEVARAFRCTTRTVRRHQRRFEEGGLSALGRPMGYPRGRPRLVAAQRAQVRAWKEEGVSNREIARRLGVTEKSIRKLLWRLGYRAARPRQESLFPGDADPNLSGNGVLGAAGFSKAGCDSGQNSELHETADAPEGADPNLSAAGGIGPGEVSPSFDIDPGNRCMDRLLACCGLLDDAAPLFRPGTKIAGAGVLLAIPAILESGALEIARDIYGSIGPAFYGLRTTFVTFLLMALLRIKRPEGLKERSPEDLGQLLGLDRSPEVKTARRKIERLASFGRAAELGRALARHRVETRGRALGFLYVDGHVRVYHGKRKLPKAHVARKRIAMPATTDYWVNDACGEPLFVVNTEANPGLVKMLPEVLGEVRDLVGDRRVTIVFDRGGYSPKLFKKLIASGFDILTYRKGRFRRAPTSAFAVHSATFDGKVVEYVLADQNVLLDRRTLRLRQVTRLCKDGHQTPILTSRTDLSTVEVAHRMFERWRQENFFKYLREEYALDALIDYATEPADPTRDVPNPARKKLDAELRRARAEVEQLLATYGIEAFGNPEVRRRTMRGFKIANAPLGQRLQEALQRVVDLEKRRSAAPKRVPVQQVTEGEVIKLRVEAKLLTDLLKMVAYQAESDLVRLLASHYRRAEDEGRTLIQNALAASGDIAVTDAELHVALDPLSSPHRTQALLALCDQLNQTRTTFPGTSKRLRFEVNPAPKGSLAFPGPRPNHASHHR